MSDENAKIKEIPEKKHHRAKVIALIILSIVLPVGAFWGATVYSIIGPYNYSRGVRELEKIIPDAIELFFNNEDEFKKIASEITENEVIRNLNISYENVMVSSAFHDRRGVYFQVERKDLSDLFIVYNPAFEYDLKFMAECKKLCDDWYILILNSPKG